MVEYPLTLISSILANGGKQPEDYYGIKQEDYQLLLDIGFDICHLSINNYKLNLDNPEMVNENNMGQYVSIMVSDVAREQMFELRAEYTPKTGINFTDAIKQFILFYNDSNDTLKSRKNKFDKFLYQNNLK